MVAVSLIAMIITSVRTFHIVAEKWSEFNLNMQIVAVQLAVENLKLEINSKKVLKLLHENQRFSVIFHFTQPGAEKTESEQSKLVTLLSLLRTFFYKSTSSIRFPAAPVCSHIRSLTQFLQITFDGLVFVIMCKPISWFSTINCSFNEQKCNHYLRYKAIYYLLEGYR